MAAKSQIRGWEVEYVGNLWVYVDNGEPIDPDRPCKQCGKKPTGEEPCDHKIETAQVGQ